MNNKALKVVLTGSALVFLAAGCSNSASTTSSSAAGSTAAVQGAATGTPMGMGYGHRGNASSTRAGMGFPNLPVGSKPFFGNIASVSGSIFTISGRTRNSSSTVSTIIDVTGSTQFEGGTQANLTAGTRVLGYGTVNSDGSINAQSLQINPTMQGRPDGNHRATSSQQ